MASHIPPSLVSAGNSLPPHTVRIKRKKHEEPVDSLFIQIEPDQKKRRYSDFVFRRVLGDIDDDPSTAEALRSKTGESPLGGRSNDAGLASVGQELGGRHAQHPLRLQNELREDEHLKNERRSTNHDAAGNLRTSSLPSGPCPSAARFGQHSLHHDFQTVRKAHIRRFEISKSALVFPQEPAGRTRKSRRAEKTNVALLFEEVNSKAMEIPHGRRTFAQRDSTGTGSRSPKKTPKRIGGLIEQRPPAHGGPSTISVPPQEEHSSSDPVESGPSKFSDLPELVQELLIENLGSIVQDGGATSQKPLKVRPKMASPRYRDRHRDAPQERVAENGGQGGGDGLVEADMEYVYDTFVREPRSKKFDQAQSNHNFGVLIVDDETQTAWEASEDLVMSDNEETEDVEDENAENYYGNDYPEEEPGDEDEEHDEEQDDDMDDAGNWSDDEN